MIRRDYNVELPLLSCHCAKKMATDILDGRDGEQCKHTKEYASALLQWNPGSSAYIQRDEVFFQRMYASLAACKKGFLARCRPIICVHAYFMKENGVANCLQPSPGMETMIFIRSHMQYARPRTGTHGCGSWEYCWMILGIHVSTCGHSCLTDRR
jgi:hypothetical protein